MSRKNASFSFFGIVVFFLTVALSVTVSVLTYVYVDVKTDGDKLTIAVVMLLVVLFLSLLFTLFDVIRRRVMIDKPVDKILEATEKIARGDFTVRLTPSRQYDKYDQYDEIMENINTLAKELGKSEVLKTDFLANFSHELKTPLSVIQNYASALQAKELDEATKKKYLQTLFTASAKLTTLVTNILKLNKLENTKLLPERKKFRLDEQLAEAVIGLESQAEKKGLEFSCEMEETEIVSSPELLEIVWNNLLSNAVKFTGEGGRITLSVNKTDANAVVSVADTGCGISAEAGKRIFDKFYQGDTSHASEGNGLGLALVKRVIDTLGGEISVHSELGKGSVFTITLKDVCREE